MYVKSFTCLSFSTVGRICFFAIFVSYPSGSEPGYGRGVERNGEIG